MSLKATKEALDLLAEDPSENHATLLAAISSLAALEKAAKTIAQWRDRPSSVSFSDIASACDLMETIAKESE